MSAEITKIIIESMPNLNVVGHPILVAIIGGLTGVFGMWLVQRSNIRMWRNEIFVKKMQEELVCFYDLLSAHIKNEYYSSSLSKLLNNKFDYENKNQFQILALYDKRLSNVKELEEKFNLIQPVLRKSLKFQENDLLKLSYYIETAKIIYNFLYNIIYEIDPSMGIEVNDYFEIYDDQCKGLQSQELKKLRDKFKLHCLATKIKLKEEDEKLYGDDSKNDNLYYNAYLNRIREELSKFEKLINEHMYREI